MQIYSWTDAVLRVSCIETNSADLSVYAIEETPIPSPTIYGRVFDDDLCRIFDRQSTNFLLLYCK